MKKILLISLILGTALAQIRDERNRIARLRRRQQLANLSDQELINGGFLPSGSSRLSDSFRGLEPSFDIFSRRRRFRTNIENVDSASPSRRDYLQSLRSSFRRNGSRERRTYMPAIKRPRFTPNLQEILPRRTPSYSPTARGVDSNWAPRIPSTVLGAGNFLPSNLNDYIERTNPVNDRSYVSPRKRKPSLIAEPIPLPSSMIPNHISTKDPVSSLSTKPDYIVPKDSILPLPHEPVGPLPLPIKPNSVVPKEPVGPLPLPIKPDYVAPNDPILPLPHEPDYVSPKEPVGPLPLPHEPDYVAPKEPVGSLPLPHKPDYVAPKEPVGPLPLPIKPDYVAPKDPILPLPHEPVGPLPLPHEPGYVAPKEPVGPLPLPIKPDYVAPKEPVGPLPLPIKPDYVAPTDPILPLSHEPDYVSPKEPVGPLPLPHKPDYVAPKEPVGPLPLPIKPDYVAPKEPIVPLPLPNEPDYVAPNDPILPLLPKPDYVPPADLDTPLLPNTPDLVAPLPSLPNIPFDPIDPLNIPPLSLPVDNPDYVPNIPDQSLDHISDTRPVSPIDPFGPLDPLDLSALPVKDANNVNFKNTGSSDAFGPLDAPLLPIPSFPSQPIGAKDPNYVEPSITGSVNLLEESLSSGPLDPIGPGIPINRPDYVDPLSIDPLNPLGPLTTLDVLDSTAVSPSNKPGYVPPNDALNVNTIGDLLGGPLDPTFPDPLSIQGDAFLEPLVSVGGVMGDPLSLLTSSKGIDPSNAVPTDAQAQVIDKQAGVLDVLVKPTEPGYVEPAVQVVAGKKVVSKKISTKGMMPTELPSDVFGPLDFPQDPLSDHSPFSLLPPDNLSPVDGGSLAIPDIPPFSGPNDPLNAIGGSSGLNDLSMHPEGYAPEPALPESALFDSPLPPIPDLPPSAQDADIPGQLLTRTEINEAARREYAKSENAFDPKWNNPNVRNSDLYVKAKEVNPEDVRPAKIKTLFDFTPGAAGADVINRSVDRVSDKTRDLMTKALKKKEGYLTKYDALRSYEG